MVIDYSYLKWPAIKFAIAATLLIIVGGAGYWLIDRQQAVVKTERNELSVLQEQENNYVRNQSIYSDYAEKYLRYVKQGVIGEEDRLSWVESLDEANKQLKLDGLAYNISAQTKMDIKAAPKAVQLFQSKMSVDMNALHSKDINTLIRYMKDRGKGYLLQDSCRMQRLGKSRELDLRADTAKVQISCDMSWITAQIQEAQKVSRDENS